MTLTPIYRRPLPWLRSFGRARFSFEEALIHPDGRRLIAIERDGTVTVWDLGDGRQLHQLPAMLSAPELDDARGVRLRLHPDGVRLFATVVITDTSDVAHCWNLDTGALIDRLGYPKIPSDFIGDRLALTAHGLYLTLWDLETGDTVRERLRRDASWGLFGVIGDHALVGGRNVIELWNVREGRMRWSVPASESRAAAIYGDAVLLASPGQFTVFELDGRERRQLPCSALQGTGRAWELHVTGDTAVIAGADEDLLAIDLATGDVRSRFAAEKHAELAVGACHAVVTDHHAASVWELATGRCRLRVRGPLALSPDGETAVTCDGPQLRLWAVDGRDHGTPPPAWTAIAAPAVPDVIVALDRAHHVHVVDHDGVPRHSWGPAGERAIVDGIHLAHAAGSVVTLLDATTGDHVRAFEAQHPVTSIAVADRWLAAVLRNGDVRMEHIADTAPPTTFRTRASHPVVLAIDATRVAIAADTTVELWRIEPPLRLHTFRCVTTPQCAAFDHTGRLLVTGHWDGALLIRDTHERAHRTTIDTTMFTVRRLALRGDRVAICGTGVAVWSLSTATCLGEWKDEDVLDVAWLDDTTVACATEHGLALLALR